MFQFFKFLISKMLQNYINTGIINSNPRFPALNKRMRSLAECLSCFYTMNIENNDFSFSILFVLVHIQIRQTCLDIVLPNVNGSLTFKKNASFHFCINYYFKSAYNIYILVSGG